MARARNWESLCLYGWHPYMHNPRLPRWLRHIACPTLVLWGASDGIVTPSYGEAYARLIPGARFELIPEAGHHPEIEQARGLRRPGGRVPPVAGQAVAIQALAGEEVVAERDNVMHVWFHNEIPYPFVPQEVLDRSRLRARQPAQHAIATRRSPPTSSRSRSTSSCSATISA